MNPSPPPLREILQSLESEGRITSERQKRLSAIQFESGDSTPWYVRLMIIASAWLATLSFLLFIGGTHIVSSANEAITAGGILLGVAIALRRVAIGELLRQIALALSLSAQLLVILGAGEKFGITQAALMCIAMAGIVFLLYPDYLQRVVSILMSVMAILVLIHDLHKADAMHLLTLSLMAAVILLGLRQPINMTTAARQYLHPAFDAVTLALFLVLGFWTLTDIAGLPLEYPKPYLTTAGMGAMLLFLQARLLALNGQSLTSPQSLAIFCATLPLLIPALQIPGMVAAIAVLLIGFQWSHRRLIYLSLGFLAIFLGAYYYQLQLSLLMKSFAMIGSGLILVLSKYVLRTWESHNQPL